MRIKNIPPVEGEVLESTRKKKDFLGGGDGKGEGGNRGSSGATSKDFQSPNIGRSRVGLRVSCFVRGGGGGSCEDHPGGELESGEA